MKIKTTRYYIYYIARIGGLLAILLPIKFASKLTGFFGRMGFVLLRKERIKTLENLRIAFSDKSHNEIENIGRDVFSNVARNFAELVSIFKISSNNIDSWVEPHGLQKIDSALDDGKGVIVLTAHFGNWELVGAYFRIKGYEGRVVARRIYFYKYNEYLIRLRFIHDVATIYRDESPKKILKLLNENKIVGMLADQDTDSVDGIFVDFFGKPAYTPTSPVRIAMISGAPLIPCYMVRRKDSKYDFIVEDPIYVKKGNDEEATIKFYTQKWTNILGSYIRKYPEQWVWMHRRWKTKPQD